MESFVVYGGIDVDESFFKLLIFLDLIWIVEELVNIFDYEVKLCFRKCEDDLVYIIEGNI